MDLNGQFMGWRHDHDLGRSLRRINARKEAQQISQCFAGAFLLSPPLSIQQLEECFFLPAAEPA
jgi:hypothetical protein